MKMKIKRKCDICGKPMHEGFCVNDDEYYCSEDCLHSRYTDREYTDMFNDDEAYCTTWED